MLNREHALGARDGAHDADVLGVDDEEFDGLGSEIGAEVHRGDQVVSHHLLGGQLIARERIVERGERRDVGDCEVEAGATSLPRGRLRVGGNGTLGCQLQELRLVAALRQAIPVGVDDLLTR